MHEAYKCRTYIEYNICSNNIMTFIHLPHQIISYVAMFFTTQYAVCEWNVYVFFSI